MRVFILCFVMSLVPVGLMASPEATGGEIYAVGAAVIYKGNLAQAKEKAISQALLKGMKDYLVKRLGSDGMINNFSRVVQEIFPSAREGVENFHILAADQTGKEYHILVRLRINTGIIEEKLRRAGLVILSGPSIKVLLMVSEKDDLQTRHWWGAPDELPSMSSVELILHNALEERGCSPVNRQQIISQTEIRADMKNSELSEQAARDWAKLYNADAVVFGRIENVHNQQVTVGFKAVAVRQESIVFQGEQSRPVTLDMASEQSETIDNLIIDMASKMAPLIIQAADVGRKPVYRLQVILTGLKTYKQFMDFREFLTENVLGVKSVKQTRVKKNTISAEVVFEGEGRKLIESVLNHARLPLLMDGILNEEGNIIFEIK